MVKDISGKNAVLAIQHVFAMFGATVLVPALTGLNPGIALISAGIGTLIFHAVTGGMVPVFLGSSFAFIGAIISIAGEGGENLPYAIGAVFFTGIIYLLLSQMVRFAGIDLIRRLFPAVVTGPVIMVIGLSLAPIAVGMASTHWPVALISMATIIAMTTLVKGFFKLVPILVGILVGYLAAMAFGIVDFTALTSNERIFMNVSDIVLPKFQLEAILTMAPIAIVSFMEHIGDITTNGAVVGKDFMKKPGLHRTLMGDGLATMFAGLVGGPANTTYSENTGVLAVTKNYNPAIIRLAAVFAIVLGIFSPIAAFLKTLPVAVMGGVSFILFGMIASIGMRTIAHSRLDFNNSRNLIIVTLILVTGLAGVEVNVQGVALKGIGLAAFVGMISNLVLHIILPDNPDND
ncbi:uracil-xanthine permease family protein [Sulfuriroseicoccus oceanibius]|uniref:Uracil-xanthine permease n=1 Tax=Sulfuriroseicoccus oceanibius TaxID=2707525 RepID=A0A6B3L3R0_9BACT|nr:solute carrier family 23 protein [Sulfuriroseicoccus oceanibius]QQL46127.1 uracil-xanthine permease [Sulfuriroseicoccus oceanibius]